MKAAISVFILRVLGLLPMWACQLLGWLLGSVLYYLPNSVRTQTQKNISRCLSDFDSASQAVLVKASLKHTAMVMLEMGPQWCASPESNLTRIQSVHGQALLQTPSGRIVITPHVGNWELFAAWLAAQTPLTAMYKPAKQAPLNRLIIAGREQAGMALAPADASGLRKLIKALKNQQSVLILPDQEPLPKAGQLAKFFGQPAYTITLVSQLAKAMIETSQPDKSDLDSSPQILLGWAKRLGIGKGFAIELIDISELFVNQPLASSVQAMNDAMADLIKQQPEQYQWEYKRFKHTLGG